MHYTGSAISNYIILFHEVKLIEKRRSQELMSVLGLKDTLDGVVRVNGV